MSRCFQKNIDLVSLQSVANQTVVIGESVLI